MLTVHKQELQIAEIQTIELPSYAMILRVDTQREVPCIWYMCNTDEPKMKVTIRCYGTGHRIEENGRSLSYVGTVLLRGGNLVLHYFREN